MSSETKRLFISDLPPGILQKDLKEKFSQYGEVASIEILHRKEIKQNQSLQFAYVNIRSDDRTLQQCFKDFNTNKFKGHYVHLQVARESFLDRLKREREEEKLRNSKNVNGVTTNFTHTSSLDVSGGNTPKIKVEKEDSIKKRIKKEDSIVIKIEDEPVKIKKEKKSIGEPNEKSGEVKSKESRELQSEESEVQTVQNRIRHNSTSSVQGSQSPKKHRENNVRNTTQGLQSEELHQDEESEIIIKDNKSKMFHRNNKLKIESQGFEPVVKIQLNKKPTEKSKDPARTEANKKRVQSITERVKRYQQQKSALKAAFANIDGTSSKKTIFKDEDEENEEVILNGDSKRQHEEDSQTDNAKRMKLFEEDDEEETEYNFEHRKQFDGKKGEKLLKLQTKTKNDKRFMMDERFLEGDDEENEDYEKYVDERNEGNENQKDEEVVEELTLEEEKAKELEIMQQVLGIKDVPQAKKKPEKPIMKMMVRYDPENPEHSKFEIKEPAPEKQSKKKKQKQLESAAAEESLPTVSKETFYEVKSDLKQSLQEKEGGFSLLSMFGTARDDEEEEPEAQAVELIGKKPSGRNPFKYDSSSDEEEEEKEKEAGQTEKAQTEEGTSSGVVDKISTLRNPLGFRAWHEPFFFQNDDYRFQEGIDFVRKMAEKHKEKDEFLKLRKNLKEIVKAKMRNNLRKDRPFKKKLGKAGRKKMIRKKKAMKR